MLTCDHRDSSETTMPQLHGLPSRHPTPLLFVQPIQQRIQLPMLQRLRTIVSASTNRTTTLVTWLPCHRFPPDLDEKRIVYYPPQFTILILDRYLVMLATVSTHVDCLDNEVLRQ